MHKGLLVCTLGSRPFAPLKYQFPRTEPNTDIPAVPAAVSATPNRLVIYINYERPIRDVTKSQQTSEQ